MNANFDGFERAQTDICDELGRSACGKVEGRLVFLRGFLASQVGIEFLEVLVAAILEASLDLNSNLSKLDSG